MLLLRVARMAHCLDTAASCPARRPYAIKAGGEQAGPHTAHIRRGDSFAVLFVALCKRHRPGVLLHPGLAGSFPSLEKARFVCFVRQLGRCHSLTQGSDQGKARVQRTHTLRRPSQARRLPSLVAVRPALCPPPSLPHRCWPLGAFDLFKGVSRRGQSDTQGRRACNTVHSDVQLPGKPSLRPFTNAVACSGTSCLIHRRLLFAFRLSVMIMCSGGLSRWPTANQQRTLPRTERSKDRRTVSGLGGRVSPRPPRLCSAVQQPHDEHAASAGSR